MTSRRNDPLRIGIDLGIDDPQRDAIAHGLSPLRADSVRLDPKTHPLHGNVTGSTRATACPRPTG